VTVALLVLAGVLLGGVYSFARKKQWVFAGILLAAAGLALAAAIAWSGGSR
jgi:membrane protein DedA with SNARE-associated domain